MKKIISLLTLIIVFGCCKKDNKDCESKVCNIEKTYTLNASKVTITTGIWGTVSSMEGNCMPPIEANSKTCTNCPVQRTIKIYQYTTLSQATPSGTSGVFYDSFSTPLVAQVNADAEGFFQLNLAAGNYTIAILENGKLYANGFDGTGGISPLSFSGGVQKVNLTMTYKAVF